MNAQTNIQLFNQLGREGYPNHEIGRVSDAYDLAMHLFTGLFQPSGRDAPVPLLAGGLPSLEQDIRTGSQSLIAHERSVGESLVR